MVFVFSWIALFARWNTVDLMMKSKHKKSIFREKTAIRRYSFSRPVSIALSDGLITEETSFFDYGCGHGDDIRHLRKLAIAATGWDPFHNTEGQKQRADVVNLGFVLNVIEDPLERNSTLVDAYSLAKKLLIVSVRVDKALHKAGEYSDGLITDKGTFQKLYTQSEFRIYLEEFVKSKVLFPAPGIAYIFKDEDLESDYLANRAFSRRLEYRLDLIEAFEKDENAKEYVRLAEDLGRVPLPEEFGKYEKLLDVFGTPRRIQRLTLRAIDKETFDGTREDRKQDILTYLAMTRFQNIKMPNFGKLPVRIRADIKSMWGSYLAAQKEGAQFLFSIGNPLLVNAMLEAAQYGKRLPDSVYFHRSGEDDLPALLRVIIFVAKQIVGELEYNVLKFQRDGRAISFLSYKDFDNDPHPALERSVRVYLPRASYGIRNYDIEQNPPILHRKDTLVTPEYPGFAKFRELTEKEEAAGLLNSNKIGFRVQWEDWLSENDLRITGHDLISIKYKKIYEKPSISMIDQ